MESLNNLLRTLKEPDNCDIPQCRLIKIIRSLTTFIQLLDEGFDIKFAIKISDIKDYIYDNRLLRINDDISKCVYDLRETIIDIDENG